MSLIQGSITLNGIQLHDIDVDPRSGGGVDANISEVGDLAVTDIGEIYIKQTVPATGWTQITLDGKERWLTEGNPTGILTVPTVAVNTTPSLIDIGAFTYYIKGVRYSYAGATGVNPNFTSGAMFSYISINAAGTLSFNSSYSAIDQANNVVIGVAASNVPTTPGGTVNLVTTLTWTLKERETFHTSFMDEAVGHLFSSGGLTSTGTNTLQVNVSAGTYFGPHQNKRTFPSQIPLTAYAVYHVASAWTYNLAAPITLSNQQYDNGTGLVNIPGGKFVSYTLLYSTQTDKFYMVYPTAFYDTLQLAEGAPINFGPFIDYSTSRLVPVAKIIIKENNAAIQEHIDVRPRAGSNGLQSFSGAGSLVTLQNAYENSLEPEIILNATRGALSIRDNSTPVSGNLLELTNNGNTQPYFSVSASQMVVLRGTATQNSANAATSMMYIEKDITAQNTTEFAALHRIQLNAAAAGATTLGIGQMGSAIYSPTAAANLTAPVGMIGSLGMAEVAGTAAASAISNIVGTNSILRNTSTNHTVANGFLYRATMDSTVTNRTNGMTNLYGFYMTDQSAITGVPAATNRWGVTSLTLVKISCKVSLVSVLIRRLQ